MAGPLLSSGSKRVSYYKPPVAEINVTPFVDVMLVLLVVFMVTAPLITQGVQVSLPEVQNTPITEKIEPIEVSIKKNGDVYIQAQKVKRQQLLTKLKAVHAAREKADVLLRADAGVPYGKVMEVMSALQTAGLVDVGLVTQPPGSN